MSKFFTAARGWLTSALALALMISMIGPAFAAGGQLGNINGVFVDATTKAPLANVIVTVVSPASRYTAKTDAKGFFQINGVNVDTYTVSAEIAGHETDVISGVTIQGDQTISLGTQSLSKHIETIGRVTGRSVTSAYQPTQTVDQTSISGTRLTVAAGKAASTDEAALALSVPGVQLTDSGNLTIRGGLSSEVGYQLDGVPFTEPFLSHNASNGFYNGLGSLQIVEGAGDASQGNVGSGVINVVPKRGTYPHFGLLDLESGGPNFDHQAALDYGFATPNGRFSEYFSYNGQRTEPNYGYTGTNAASYGNIDGVSYSKNDDFLSNTIYRFGKDNHESIAMLYENRNLQQYGDLSGLTGRVPYLYNPYVIGSLPQAGPGTPSDGPFLTSSFPTLPYQPISAAAPTTAELTSFNPTRFLKFEYDNSLNASTFLDVKTYNWQQIQGGSNYYQENTVPNAASQFTGGSRTGISFDITKTLGTAHTLTFGAGLTQVHPIWDGVLAYDSSLFLDLYYLNGLTGGGIFGPSTSQGNAPIGSPPAGWGYGAGMTPTLTDYELPVNGLCPSTNAAPGPNGCYLSSVLGAGNVPKIPSFGINYNKTDLQQYNVYLRDQYIATKNLRFDLGLRIDGENWKQGANPYYSDLSNPYDLPLGQNTVIPGDNYLRSAVVHPSLVQPRFAASYQLGRNDSLRFGYGRSTIFSDAQTLGTPGALYGANGLTNVPALGNTADPATWTCGSGYNGQHTVTAGGTQPNLNAANGGGYFRCSNYAQQLYWAYDQNLDAPDAGNNIPPTQSNTDLTYSHLFKNGTAVRATGYYARSYSVPEFSIISQILNAQGVPISQVFGVENVGVKKVSGLEFALTTPERALGFTGFLSATYTNALNTVPPLVAGEDGLPLVPAASIKLGNLYRVGYISPFTARAGGQYKFKNGFRINPVIAYDRGYPTGVGNIIATQLNGAGALSGVYNAPQTNVNAPTYSGFLGVTGSYNATNYVDPVNPGNLFTPNIAATRGTSETSAAGGILTRPRLTTDLSVEYTHGRNTFGIATNNLFANVYSEPILNPYWQPVATGVGGPQTATTSPATPGTPTYTYGGFRNIPLDAYGNHQFIELPLKPLTYRLYYQVRL